MRNCQSYIFNNEFPSKLKQEKRWQKGLNVAQNFHFNKVHSQALMCYFILFICNWLIVIDLGVILTSRYSNNPVTELPTEELDLKLQKHVYMLYIPPSQIPTQTSLYFTWAL